LREEQSLGFQNHGKGGWGGMLQLAGRRKRESAGVKGKGTHGGKCVIKGSKQGIRKGSPNLVERLYASNISLMKENKQTDSGNLEMKQ